MEIMDKDNLPFMNVLIHSSSFVVNDSTVNLLELNLTGYINIDATPTSNTEIIETFSKYNIVIPKYKIDRNHIAMVYENGFKNPRLYQDVYSKRISKLEISITNDDLLFVDNYDYFISEVDSSIFTSLGLLNVLTLQEFRKIVGIILSNNNIFFYRYRYAINEGFYYQLRVDRYFTFFQKYWIVLMHYGKNDPLFDKQIFSLSSRLLFITMAYEQIVFLLLARPSNDILTKFLYHFGFFVILCTGIFDDLAWMITYYYKITLNRMKISLKNKGLINKIGHFNHKMYAELNDSSIQEIIESFYPIRDLLQHRDYMKGYTVQSGSVRKHMLNIDTEAYNKLKKLIEIKVIQDNGTTTYSVDPNILVEHLFSSLRSIIHIVLKNFDWETIMNSFDEIRKDEINQDIMKYDNGLGEYYEMPGEPTYI